MKEMKILNIMAENGKAAIEMAGCQQCVGNGGVSWRRNGVSYSGNGVS